MNKNHINRIIYILCLGGAIALGIYKDGYVSTMLFYMVLLVPVASLIHLFYTYSQFRLLETLDRKSVVKGDTIKYKYEITNYSRIMFAPIRVRFAESKVLFKDSVLAEDDYFVLYPGETRVIEKSVDCKYRGFYYIGIDYIYISDFVGIFTIPFRVSEHQKILVYPLIREMQQKIGKDAVFEEAESIVSHHGDNASVFSDIRTYRQGDSLRHIHWKLSSKKNELMTKEFDGSSSSKTTILIDADGLPFEYEQNIVFQDYVVEACVSVIKELLNNNASVTMLNYRMSLEKVIGTSQKDFAQFYDAMAKMMFSQSSFHDQLLVKYFTTFAGESNMMLFLPFITQETASFIEKQSIYKRNISIFIVDPHEPVLSNCFDQIDLEPMYDLLAQGFAVYKIKFENGACRLDVA